MYQTTLPTCTPEPGLTQESTREALHSPQQHSLICPGERCHRYDRLPTFHSYTVCWQPGHRESPAEVHWQDTQLGQHPGLGGTTECEQLGLGVRLCVRSRSSGGMTVCQQPVIWWYDCVPVAGCLGVQLCDSNRSSGGMTVCQQPVVWGYKCVSAAEQGGKLSVRSWA